VSAIPAGAVAAQLMSSLGLLESLYFSVPVAAVLGLAALAAQRRARFTLARSVFRDGANTVRAGRFLAWAGLYLALVGGIALGVYAVLHYSS
jgi:energy-converting hydrogenase Eha subunit A